MPRSGLRSRPVSALQFQHAVIPRLLHPLNRLVAPACSSATNRSVAGSTRDSRLVLLFDLRPLRTPRAPGVATGRPAPHCPPTLIQACPSHPPPSAPSSGVPQHAPGLVSPIHRCSHALNHLSGVYRFLLSSKGLRGCCYTVVEIFFLNTPPRTVQTPKVSARRLHFFLLGGNSPFGCGSAALWGRGFYRGCRVALAPDRRLLRGVATHRVRPRLLPVLLERGLKGNRCI